MKKMKSQMTFRLLCILAVFGVTGPLSAATKLNTPLSSGGHASFGGIAPDSTRVVYYSKQAISDAHDLYSVPIDGGVPVKLIDVFATGSSGVGNAVVNADSTRVVYQSDHDTVNLIELYSVPVLGGTVVKLNETLPDVGVESDFMLSADGTRVIYRSFISGGHQLYSVPVNGGTVVKLNGSLVSGGNVSYRQFSISVDSTRVVYVADQDIDGVRELYSVPIGGGPSVKLNGSLVTGGDVATYFRLSADSTRVVYLADQDTDGVDELYSVPIGGGTPVKLNGLLVSGGEVRYYMLSEDSTRVVYLADQDTDNVHELYSVPIAGGTPVKLNGSLITGSSVGTGHLISADSTRVVYRAVQDTYGVLELYSVPIEGGSSVKLSGPMVSGGGAERFTISPDSTRVVYRADQDTDERIELYSVPIGGGTPVKLNGPLVSGRYLEYYFYVNADSTHVVYSSDQDTDNIIEVFSVPIAGGPLIKLNDELVAGGGVLEEIELSPDGRHLIYSADQDIDGVYELYSAPMPMSAKLNDPLVSGGDVDSFRVSPDGSRVVYVADEDTDGVDELYSVPVGGGTVSKLNDTLVSGGDVLGVGWWQDRISPDSSRVVYRADQDTDGVYELYSVPLAGGTVVKLNPALSAGAVNVFSISPDSSRVVYWADQDAVGCYELYSVPITGGTATKLNGVLVAGGDVNNYAITPDSNFVVYLADQDSSGMDEIYRVPLAGGTATKLNGTLVAGGNVLNYMFSPDSSRVVYQADQDTDWVEELYSVPLAGGTVTKLNDTLVSGGRVGPIFKISPDSSQVVYKADQETDGAYELYSVALDGGTVVKLNGTLDSGGSVFSDFLISPDSSRVVYQADQVAADIYEIYSVPLTGGTAVKINGIEAFATFYFSISPDSSHVVYGEDEDQDQGEEVVLELYSVPLTGGTTVKLNNALVAGGNVWQAQINPDGTRVVYRADQDTDEVNELYHVPVTGGTAVKLNGMPVAGGDVLSDFEITPNNSHVVYRADQDTDGVYELYSVPLGVQPDLAVGVSDSPDPVVTGSNVTYTVTVVNNGEVAAMSAVVTDTLPAEAAFVSCSRAYTLNGKSVVCNLGTLSAGTNVTYTITASVASGTTAGYMNNSVSVASPSGDTNPTDNTDTCRTTIIQACDLGVTKTAPAGSVLAGDDLIYTITVTNSYSTEAEWIVVTDTLPTGTVYKSSSIMGMEMMGSVEFYLETSLAAYASTTFTMTVNVELDAPDVLTNLVAIACNGFDVNPSDNTDQHITLVAYPPLVAETAPGDGAASSADVVVDFNTAINPSTVDTASFRVQGLLNGPYVGTFTIVGSTVTFNPTQDFLPGDTITCSLTADMESVAGLSIHPHLFQFRASVPYGMDAPLTDSGQMLGQNMSYAVALGDLDRDGDLDAFVANGEDMMMMGGGAADKLWLNNGSGVFIDSGLNLGTNVSRCVALGDLDGDGDQDVLIGAGMNSDGTPAPNRVLLNNLPNTFTFTPTGAIVSDSICYDVALGDLDGDGDLDIFEANGPDMMMTTMGENRVLFNDGSGTFTDSGQLLGFADSRSVTLGDLDGDGDLDAVVGNYNEDSVVMINDGHGYFSENMLMDMSGPGGSQSIGVELGDLNGNGDLDLWLASESGGSTWTNSGNGYLEKSQSLGGSENFITVALGDLDADGDLDAVTPNYNFEMDTFFAWRNAGGTFSNRTDNPSLSMPYDAALGDLNGDGTLDLFIAGDGANTVWYGQLPAALDLDIAKSANPYTVTNSNALSYTITVSNLSVSAAFGVVVVDTLPAGVSFGSSVPAADSVNDGICTYNLGTLGAGSSTSIVMQVTVADTTSGSITNTATVSHSAPDPNSANDLAECVVNVNDNDSDGDPDFHDPDDDNDTLPDIWENGYSLNPLSAADASGNPDLDPYVNTDEYILDYNPTISNGWFRIIGITNKTVYFNSSVNRNYTLRGCSNLVEGIWFDIPGCGPRLGFGGTDSLHDSSDAEPIFYKVRVELP